MANLYYGKGNCIIEGNVVSITIHYKGAIIIESKLPNGYTIAIENGKLIIEPFLSSYSLNELFYYMGVFNILYATAKNIDGNKEDVTITKRMDYSELLETNAEDMTTKSEDLKVTSRHGRSFRKTRVLNKVMEGLNTLTLEKTLLLNNEIYTGNYHLHVDGTIMSGAEHTKDSQVLAIGV
tara:strand:+ start:1493 stop:2032 length:540 start_codon:yes stop_codon:yes gene_type:complete